MMASSSPKIGRLGDQSKHGLLKKKKKKKKKK